MIRPNHIAPIKEVYFTALRRC